MRLYSLDIIQEIIEATPAVTALLGRFEVDNGDGTFTQYPNVAQDIVPNGMIRPYIVLREEADAMAGNDLLGSALVSADIFVEGSRSLALQIGGELEKLFDKRHYEDNPGVGTGAKKSFIRQRLNVPQPDPSVKCRQIKIELHYLRDDLLVD